MQQNQGQLLKMVVKDVKVAPAQEGYHPVEVVTSRGEIHCRYYPVAATQRGTIWVGGVGGGWDTPANGLYPQLCQELTTQGIASLRIRFRYPTIIEEAILDVLAGINFLESEGIKAIALIGHSFGGAVVIQAATYSQTVITIVTLATQSYGAAPACELGPHCSILLVHGTDDEVLSPFCSQYIYQIAQQPKRLIIYPGASHSLDKAAQEVHDTVRDWVSEKLNQILV